jgi:hypothetical protein
MQRACVFIFCPQIGSKERKVYIYSVLESWDESLSSVKKDGTIFWASALWYSFGNFTNVWVARRFYSSFAALLEPFVSFGDFGAAIFLL